MLLFFSLNLLVSQSRSEAMIGSEVDSAKRVREYRKRKALQCNSDETKSNTEIDIELDKEKKKQEDLKKKKRSII